MAYDGGRVFVPVVDLCSRGSASGYEHLTRSNPLEGTGEFVALAGADRRGALEARSFRQPDFGCATVAAGVVFTSTFDGQLYGFDSTTGATLWQARAPAGINGCPALSGGLLLVPAGSGTTKVRTPKFELIAYGLPA